MTTATRLVVLCCLALSLTGCQYRGGKERMNHRVITLSGQQIDVELATTPDEQRVGLGKRAALADGYGMLFPFPPNSTPTFWMKDMRFPIDILWIRNSVVTGIESNVPADDGAIRYSPKEPIDSVLELPGTWTQRHGTSVGDRIE